MSHPTSDLRLALHADSNRLSGRPGRRGAAALLAAAMLAGPAFAADPPDLVALSIAGPGQVEIGAISSVNTFVVNLGGPLTGDIEFDILLTQDLVIDESDTLVLAHSTSFVGALNVPIQIPPSLTPGTYNWALRVKPQDTEVTTFNNEIIGGEVTLFVLDLCLSSTASIEASTIQGGDDPATIQRQVANCGSGGAILIFSVSAEPAAPWLTVTPSTSFVVAGGQPQPIQISFDAAGLAPGEYATTLRFQSFSNPLDFELIPVSLTIGEARFDVGDALIGEIMTGYEEDVARFDMVAGEKLKLKFTTSFGNLKPQVDILDADDLVVDSFLFATSAKKSKGTFKAQATGEYRVRVTGRDGTLGAYVIDTARKLPKAASQQKVKATVDGAGAVEVELLALPDATLDFVAKPKSALKATLDATLSHPDEGALDISSYVQATEVGLEATGIPLPVLGAYTLRVTGAGDPGDKVKLVISPTQPAEGGATVLIP